MSDLVEQARKVLKDNGSRWTKQRQQMIEILAEHPDHYIDFTDVDQRLRKDNPGLSHGTVYRNLKDFESLGIVETRQAGERMQVKVCCDSNHHHHFICDVCGRVQEIQCHQLIMPFLPSNYRGLKLMVIRLSCMVFALIVGQKKKRQNNFNFP